MKVRVLAMIVILISVVGLVFAQDETIVDIAAGNEDFSTLVDLVTTAGLVDTLAGDGSFTVFAPTNDAFAALPQVAVDYLLANPDVLEQVLLYHVVDGAIMSGDLSDGMAATSMDMGNELTIAVNDMGVMVDNATVVTADIEGSNGVIHVIDTVLIPPQTLEVEDPAFVEGNIVTAGSSTVGPLSEAIQEVYDSQGFIGTINNSIIGSGAGFERFCVEGETDISNASRGIKDGEVESCNAIGRNPIEFRVGTDGIAVVVNLGNDFVDDLTFEELQLAFSTATTWADVRDGFPDEEIIRYFPGTDSGTFDFFVEEVFDEDSQPILDAANGNPNEDDNVLLEGVANNANAIGFFGYAYYDQNQDALKLISIDTVEPNAISVEDGSYLLARPLFIYSDAEIIAEKPQVGEFIKFYLANVDDMIGEVGYFPANPFGLNASKFIIRAATGSDMGM